MDQSAETDPVLPPIWQPPQPVDLPDHPDGDAIRRQVEYYFSDENLPTDAHMLEKMGGNLNLPVSVRHILGFRRMRGYKPYTSVVEALKRSTFLDITPDNKIRRKVPFIMDNEADDSDYDEELKKSERKAKVLPQPIPDPLHPGMTRGMLKPTGFEEYYTDPPVAPAVFTEEQSIYDPVNPLSERLEIAIQRYKQKRKFHQKPALIFNSWLKLGGVEAGQRQFTGRFDEKDMEDKDAGYIAQMMATHHIGVDKEDQSIWAVDFEGVAKGFLSSKLPMILDLTLEDISLATRIMRNFYNYLLHHNVCPECNTDINRARAVCDLAEKELPLVLRVGLTLPGDFNMACSTLFSGRFAGLYADGLSWTEGDRMGDGLRMGLARDQARVIFRTGIFAYGTDELLDDMEGKEDEWFDGVECTDERELGLEVTGIEPASESAKEVCPSHMSDSGVLKQPVHPVGKLHCKTWQITAFEEPDLPLDHPSLCHVDEAFEFLVEDEVLEMCFVGMKMEGMVRKLDLGQGTAIAYLDNVSRVYCSFYTYLLNELMPKPWKEVRWLKKKGVRGVNEA